jgi:hypothetical protein
MERLNIGGIAFLATTLCAGAGWAAATPQESPPSATVHAQALSSCVSRQARLRDALLCVLPACRIRPRSRVLSRLAPLKLDLQPDITVTCLSGDLNSPNGCAKISGMGGFAGARKFVYATVLRQQNGALVLASWKED